MLGLVAIVNCGGGGMKSLRLRLIPTLQPFTQTFIQMIKWLWVMLTLTLRIISWNLISYGQAHHANHIQT